MSVGLPGDTVDVPACGPKYRLIKEPLIQRTSAGRYSLRLDQTSHTGNNRVGGKPGL
jgi:hypothetical protein